MGKNIGYVRVSSVDQSEDRQLDGIDLDKTFLDKVSGKDINRPQLQEMLTYVRDGDIVYVHSMDRLARNLDDLRRIVKKLTKQKVKVKFLKESLTFTGDDTPMSKLLLSIMGAFSEFERSLIKERQREGIAIAKKKGLYRGRKPALTPEQVILAKQRSGYGENKTAIAKSFGITRETLYKYMRKT
jgi:DNA invertase Pin-like site-specific DNA recombinase